MPKETFFNLPNDKRERFLEAAIDEFAENDYPNASISRLVKRLGIAKGSFYQYFDDKQDLFRYLIQLMAEEKRALFAQIDIPDPNAGLFDTLRWMLKLQTKFDFAHPKLAEVGYRALYGAVPFKDEMIETFRAQGDAGLREMVDRAVARGELRADVDPSIVVFMLSTLFSELGEYLADRLGIGRLEMVTRQLSDAEWDAMNREFDQLISVLETGLTR